MTKEKKSPPAFTPRQRKSQYHFDKLDLKPGESAWFAVPQSNQVASAFSLYLTRGRFTVRKEVKDGKTGFRLYYLK